MEKVLILFCGLLAVSQAGLPTNLGSRIVNGEPVQSGEIPYIVSLQNSYGHFCGGSIINKYFIVTASHCVRGEVASRLSVHAGTVLHKQPLQKVNVDYIVPHAGYNPSDSYRNDIAIIKVKEPFVFNELVKPVKLPEEHQFIKPNSTAVVSGWGYTGFGSHIIPDHLLKTDVFIVDPDYCKAAIDGTGYHIHDSHICAWNPKERKGECNGDSGGPVTVNEELVGIVSWSIKDPYCASTKYPGVYTRVTEFINWINENTQL